MSNLVTLEKIEIHARTQGQGKDVVEKGFRLYDSYDQTTRTPLEGVPDDDLELLEMVVKDFRREDGAVDCIVDSLLFHEQGLQINDTWYEFEDVKKILKTPPQVYKKTPKAKKKKKS